MPSAFLTRRRTAVAASLASAAAAAMVLAGAPAAVSQQPAALATVGATAAKPSLNALLHGGIEPESPEKMARFAAVQATHAGADFPGDLRAGIAQRAALERTAASVPGTTGKWSPLGKGPLIANDPTYQETYGNGFADLSGRITDFAYSPRTHQLWTTAAQGGVWESNDVGASWRSIGDGLPFQSVSGIAWTPAGGGKGTLVVLTGDHAFSNNYAGLGAYWTTDDGKRWHHAAGIPDGALGFKIAVDPTKPAVMYAATGFGLYRSADAGRHWANVKLPTGSCTGNSLKKDCFFANIATDVEVQGADTFGHKGGAVVTALGFRAGRYPNFNGKPQAPANGIYRSDTGAIGSFKRVPDGSGITASKDFGRTALGAAHGPDQNSAYLYAIVQNSTAFTTGEDQLSKSTDGDPLGLGVDLTAKTSDLDGIYVSPDFGKTWKLMESGREMTNPANGSSLNQLTPLGISAGYQVTYNEWIKPDPTRTINGVPSRLVFGLEELWQNAVPGPQDGNAGAVSTPYGDQGTSYFQTFGSYNQAGPCLVTLASHACSTARQPDPAQTTTHPDQHGGIFIANPEAPGDVTLVVGNDGGVYRQTTNAVTPFTQVGFGNGAQVGFHDLLPYGVAMAKDGTTYMGLQDNGEAKIDKTTGKQYMVYGGDGVFTLVDPDNSDIAYEEYPGARVAVTTDGGKTFTDMAPGSVTDADFVTPLVMDPHNAKHIVTGGRQIVETTNGPATGTGAGATGWQNVYDLGTSSSPGDGGKATAKDPANHVVSLAVDGPNIYAGFCGSCDPVKLHQKFKGGLATNVGGSAKPHTGSDDGWHIAKAKGLPQRFITSIAMDPKNPRTVYVTLGASAARYWAPIGALGEDAGKSRGGYVYKSTDAGETFADITGNLPKLQATWVLVRGKQLIVSNAIGVFISKDLSGKSYAPLGKGLPSAAVFSMQLKPGDPNTLVVASYGRGAYVYTFPANARLKAAAETPPRAVGGSSATAARRTAKAGNAPAHSVIVAPVVSLAARVTPARPDVTVPAGLLLLTVGLIGAVVARGRRARRSA